MKQQTAEKPLTKAEVQEMMKCLKGEVLKEFEKICPTETSFRRVKKDMHDLFDRAEEKCGEL